MAGKPVNIRIGATLAGSMKAVTRDARSQLGRLGQALAELDKKKSGAEQLRQLKTRTDELGRAYSAARRRADELRRAHTAAGPPTAAQAREMQRAAQAAEKAGRALQKERDALRELRASLRAAGVDTRHLGEETARLGSRMERLRTRSAALSRAREAERTNRDRRGEYLGGMMSTLGVGMALAAPARTAIDFEAQMSRVGAISNSTAQQQARLTAEARKQGRDTQFSALEAAQGMEYLAMAGFNEQQQRAAIGGMLDIAAAAGSELGRTADIVSNALTGFGLQAKESGRVGDVLAKTFTSSNTTLESLGDTFKYVAPVAKSAGASIELTAAMAGVLGDAGIQGSMAGTALRNTFLRLIAPARDARKHMQQLGISAEQMTEIMADPEGAQAARYIRKMGIDVADEKGNLRDWLDILTELSTKMDNLTQEERLEAASSIFGKYAVSGGLALLDALKYDQTYLDEQTKNMREQGATETQIREYLLKTRNKLQDRYNKNLLASQERFAKKTAARMLDNVKGSLTILGSAMSDLAITTGDLLSPSIRSSAETLTVLANRASELMQRFPGLSKAVLVGTGSLLTLGVATYALGFAWTVLKHPFLKIGAIFAKVRAELALLQAGNAATGASASLAGAQWGRFAGSLGKAASAIRATSLALLSSPVGWIAMAIAGAALLVYKYWQPVSAFMGGVFRGIVSAFHPVLAVFEPLEPVFRSIGEAISGVFTWFSRLLEPVRSGKGELEDFSSSGERVGRLVGQAFRLALAPVELMLTAIGKVIGGVRWLISNKEAVTSYVGEKWDQAAGKVGQAWDSASGWAGKQWDSLAEGVSSLFGGSEQPAPSPRPVPAATTRTNTFAPNITIMSPPGADAQGLARAAADAVQDALRRSAGPGGPLYDY